MMLNSARPQPWKRKKDGAWVARLPARLGPPVNAVVRLAHSGWYFGLFGRKGRPLGGWQSGYELSEEAMAAAADRAGQVDDRKVAYESLVGDVVGGDYGNE